MRERHYPYIKDGPSPNTATNTTLLAPDVLNSLMGLLNHTKLKGRDEVTTPAYTLNKTTQATEGGQNRMGGREGDRPQISFSHDCH